VCSKGICDYGRAEQGDGFEQAETTPHLAEIKTVHFLKRPLEKNMTASRLQNPFMKRLMRWIVPDQRVANRHAMPPVVAYLGMVRSTREYKIGDVSVSGFFMITEERWIPGSGFPVTLRRTDSDGHGKTLSVYCTVVRVGVDGVGFTFLPPAVEDRHASDARDIARLDLTKLAEFLKGLPLSEPSSEAWERVS
jgi:hypothetical protein